MRRPRRRSLLERPQHNLTLARPIENPIAERLRLSSPEVLLRVTEDVAPLELHFGMWFLRETFAPAVHLRASKLWGSYRIIMESRVPDPGEAGTLYLNGSYLAQDIDCAFSYATGRPMGGRSFQAFLPPITPPLSWTLDEGRELIDEDDWENLARGISYETPMRTMPSLPLQSTLGVLKALRQANQLASQLSTYHYGAQSSHDPQLALLLLAQGLEMGRSLLPGKAPADQESRLPDLIRTRLRRRLNWLYEVSNQRRETRHAINKAHAVELKPEFTDDEKSDFFNDADLLLHFLVTKQLGMPVVVCDDGVSVAAS